MTAADAAAHDADNTAADAETLRRLLDEYATAVRELRVDVSATAARVTAARTAIADARLAFERDREPEPPDPS